MTSLFDCANIYTKHSHKQIMIQKTIAEKLKVVDGSYTYLPIINDSNINIIVDHILKHKLHFLKLELVYDKIPHNPESLITQIVANKILTPFNINEILKGKK